MSLQKNVNFQIQKSSIPMQKICAMRTEIESAEHADSNETTSEKLGGENFRGGAIKGGRRGPTIGKRSGSRRSSVSIYVLPS